MGARSEKQSYVRDEVELNTSVSHELVEIFLPGLGGREVVVLDQLLCGFIYRPDDGKIEDQRRAHNKLTVIAE